MSAVGDGEDESDVKFGLARLSAVGDGFGTGDIQSCICETGSWTNASHPDLLPFLFLFVLIAIRICFMVFDLYISACMYL